MASNLYKYFEMAQHNKQEYTISLYYKFLPIIKGFGRKLNYEEAESDLTIFLLELIKKIDLNKIKNRSDGEIVNYIHSAFKNHYINILKNIVKKNIEIITYKLNLFGMIVITTSHQSIFLI